MQKTLATIAASALLLAGGLPAAQAQQGTAGSAAQQDRPAAAMDQRGGDQRPGQDPMMGRGMGGHMMHGGMMHGGMQAPHRKGAGRHGPNMLVMMMAMMDANGDRALSLEEVQAVHERVFRYADTDSDGSLSLEELRQFFHGGALDTDQ